VGQPTTPEPDSCNLSVDSGGGGPARFAAECSLITPFVVVAANIANMFPRGFTPSTLAACSLRRALTWPVSGLTLWWFTGSTVRE
jgi:hypothetical protein